MQQTNTYKPHKIEAGKYLYRGYIVERVTHDNHNHDYWIFDEEEPSEKTLGDVCWAIDRIIDEGFMHRGEGVMGTFPKAKYWTSLDECYGYSGGYVAGITGSQI